MNLLGLKPRQFFSTIERGFTVFAHPGIETIAVMSLRKYIMFVVNHHYLAQSKKQILTHAINAI